MLTMVCAKALSKGNKACSCVRSVNKVAWEAMIQERTYLSRIGRSSLRSRTKQDFFFFFCIAERAIKPCRSSRSKLRGEFGIPRHSQNRKPKTQNKQKTKAGKCWNVKREVRRG